MDERSRPLTHVKIVKVVSGGQTGVDRGALRAAIHSGIAHGGWCPLGRRSETGPIPDEFQLKETETADYTERTLRNVLDSDGTLILYCQNLKGGTRLTWNLAQRHEKPVIKVDLDNSHASLALQAVDEWVRQYSVETLNVAGPRESGVEGIEERSLEFLLALLGR